MKNNHLYYLFKVFILIGFSSCSEERTSEQGKKSNTENITILPPDYSALTMDQLFSTLKNDIQLEAGRLYVDTVIFVDYSDDIDDMAMDIITKGNDTVSIRAYLEENQKVYNGDKILMQWSMDTLSSAGDENRYYYKEHLKNFTVIPSPYPDPLIAINPEVYSQKEGERIAFYDDSLVLQKLEKLLKDDYQEFYNFNFKMNAYSTSLKKKGAYYVGTNWEENKRGNCIIAVVDSRNSAIHFLWLRDRIEDLNFKVYSEAKINDEIYALFEKELNDKWAQIGDFNFKRGNLLLNKESTSESEINSALQDAPQPKAETNSEMEPKEKTVENLNFSDLKYIAKPYSQEPIEKIIKRVQQHVRSKNIVYVSTVEQFLKAINSNTIIILKPGKYIFKESDSILYKSISAHFDPKFNMISGVKNMAIIGLEMNMEYLLQPSPTNNILTFYNCENIFISNLIFSHTTNTENQRSCIYLETSKHVTIESVLIYSINCLSMQLSNSKNNSISNSVFAGSSLAILHKSELEISNCNFNCEPFCLIPFWMHHSTLRINASNLKMHNTNFFTSVAENQNNDCMFRFQSGVADDSSVISIVKTTINGKLVNQPDCKQILK